MTQEEKQLLLKDLCARLPYNVKVHINGNSNIRTIKGIDLIVTDEGELEYAITSLGSSPIELKYIKPYLRPMSSMTEEEENEYKDTCVKINGLNSETSLTFDWLNEHHFDHRDLIEKGLALEAPEGMYKF